MLSLQPPVVVEGQTAMACLSLYRLDRLSENVNLTLSTVAGSSTATGMRIDHAKLDLRMLFYISELIFVFAVFACIFR